MFRYGFSNSLKLILKRLYKKNKTRYNIVKKKINEIVLHDLSTIDHYKNLRNDLSDYKRVHIDKSFVLLFRVYKKEKFILFDSLKHYDDVYKP